ncbi:MAG: DUF4157 domain-containing protein [Stigonema ocellatum SAG 48.90 = DSM 106950]|nr:DUF4157 domain-containing protein [Stigonema ocellatum SAG 48.90 = DSM 106950]
MREHLSLEKKTTRGFSIPSLKHPVRGFGLDSPYAAPQAVPVQQARFQPRSHDLSRISMRPQAKLTVNQPGDIYEQEADRVAQQVMGKLGQPGSSQSIQREQMPEEEEELQMKPLDNSTLQRQQVPEEEEELQRSPMVQRQAEAFMAAAPDVEASINQARGGGQAMADNIRQPMEQAFGADFSGVKVHTDGQSDQLNRSIQARAFTTGQDVFFRSGEYNPGSRGGQELLAHELTHVVQQNGGAVQRSPQLHEIVRQLPTAKTASTLTGDNIIQAKGAGDKIAAQLRIWKRILDKKQLPDNVYRIDSRTPEEISQTGFQPHNDNGNISIEEHVTGVLDQALVNGNTLAKYESQYVSTAAYKGLKDAVLAQVSGGKYLYKIDTAAINLANASFTDVNDYFDRRRKPRPYPEQREWIKQGGIPGAAVRQYMNAQTFYTQEVDVVDGQIVLPDENSISRWQNMP